MKCRKERQMFFGKVDKNGIYDKIPNFTTIPTCTGVPHSNTVWHIATVPVEAQQGSPGTTEGKVVNLFGLEVREITCLGWNRGLKR